MTASSKPTGARARTAMPKARAAKPKPKAGRGTAEPVAPDDPGTSLVDRIYAWLEGKFVTLELPPGALLSELTIAREFGVSRTPVGEALQRLAREGLVTVLPRRGIVVTEISVTEQLRLLELRREIANFIARLGAKRANPAERAALRSVADRFVQAAARRDEEGLLAADKDFHDLFASCAHNNYAAMAMGPLDSLSRRFYYLHRMDEASSGQSARLHANIALAIAAGDSQAAEDATNAMADYLDEFARGTLDLPAALAPRAVRA